MNKKTKAGLSTDMLNVMNEHCSYFMARLQGGKAGPVWDLYGGGLDHWDKSASPRCITACGDYDVMITPRGATCSCKAYVYSKEDAQTCKHIQAVLMTIWDSGYSFILDKH